LKTSIVNNANKKGKNYIYIYIYIYRTKKKKKSSIKTYHRSVVDIVQPQERAYRDNSNIIAKGSIATPKEVAHIPKSKLTKIS
jgi:hypothetical protein